MTIAVVIAASSCAEEDIQIGDVPEPASPQVSAGDTSHLDLSIRTGSASLTFAGSLGGVCFLKETGVFSLYAATSPRSGERSFSFNLSAMDFPAATTTGTDDFSLSLRVLPPWQPTATNAEKPEMTHVLGPKARRPTGSGRLKLSLGAPTQVAVSGRTADGSEITLSIRCGEVVGNIPAGPTRTCFAKTGIVPPSEGGGRARGKATQIAAAQALAKRIVEGSASEGLAATQEVLARAGIATVDGPRILVPARAPAGSIALPLPLVMTFARDAHDRRSVGTLSLRDLDIAALNFGWPCSLQQPESPPFSLFMAEWLSVDRWSDDPEDFTPLFLLEMIELQSGQLTPGNLQSYSGSVWFGPLELYLIIGAFDRLIGVDGLRSDGGGHGLASVAAAGACDIFDRLAGELGRVAGPATGRAASYGAAVGDRLWNRAASKLTSVSLKRALELHGLTPDAAARLLGVIDAIGIMVRVMNLATFYQYQVASVVAEPNLDEYHKSNDRGPVSFVDFVARAGVDPLEYSKYRATIQASDWNRAVRECMDVFGLPYPADIVDVAKDAQDWRVRWALCRGFRAHADFRLSDQRDLEPGGVLLSRPMRRVNDVLVESVLRVKLQTEADADHVSPTRLVSDRVSVFADILTARPPSDTTVDSLVRFLRQGDAAALADTVVQFAVGMFQTLVTKRVNAGITVTWHIHVDPSRGLAIGGSGLTPDASGDDDCTGSRLLRAALQMRK